MDCKIKRCENELDEAASHIWSGKIWPWAGAITIAGAEIGRGTPCDARSKRHDRFLIVLMLYCSWRSCREGDPKLMFEAPPPPSTRASHSTLMQGTIWQESKAMDLIRDEIHVNMLFI